MKLLRVFLFLCLCAAPLFAQTSSSGPRVEVGVTPVFNANDMDFSSNFVQHMTFMLYKRMLNRADVEPLLLNPGGVFDSAPGGDEWTAVYAHKLGADVVLIVSLLPNAQTSHHSILGDSMSVVRVSAVLLDVNSGRRSPLKNFEHNVSVTDLLGYSGTSVSFWSGEHKSFEKQKKGKVAAGFVDEILQYVDQQLPALSPQSSGQPLTATAPSSSSCPVDVSVRYMPRNVNSMAYNLIVNGKDESAAIKDGVARVLLPVGPVVVQGDMKDTPHRMTPQKYYQANAVFHCSPQEKNLVIELSVAGDAQLLWEP